MKSNLIGIDVEVLHKDHGDGRATHKITSPIEEIEYV